MALAGVLSAMRELLLDKDDLPSSVEERLSTYREWFPDLTDEEIDDLAKIPGEKIKVYTGTIFQGESSVIANHLEVTLAIVRTYWKEITGQRFDTYRFIRRTHKSRPWKDNTTNGLLENVMRHIKEDIPQLQSLAPWVTDMADFEYLRLQIKRTPDETPDIRSSLSREDLANVTVEELLGLTMLRSETSRLQTFPYDVVSAYMHYYRHDETLPDEVEKKTTYAVGGRGRNQLSQWYLCDALLYSYLQELPIGQATMVESLAAFFLENLQHKPQEEVFQEFIKTLADLNDIGVLLLLPPEA